MIEKPEIVGDMVRVEGRLWRVLEVDGTSVHLVNGVEGVCVEITDAALLAAVEALPRAS